MDLLSQSGQQGIFENATALVISAYLMRCKPGDPMPEATQRAITLAEKCKEFSVTGHIHRINPGPVVTTFEFKPDAGVKYSKITGLADDLCLAMQAESVLIDRIPGKSTVGIQIPNARREAITLRELEGLSYEEIAEVMNCPIGTVRSRIFRAREAIAEQLRPLLGTSKDKRW